MLFFGQKATTPTFEPFNRTRLLRHGPGVEPENLGYQLPGPAQSPGQARLRLRRCGREVLQRRGFEFRWIFGHQRLQHQLSESHIVVIGWLDFLMSCHCSFESSSRRKVV